MALTNEQRLSARVRRSLKASNPYWVHLVRVENAVGPGTPDLNWAVGDLRLIEALAGPDL